MAARALLDLRLRMRLVESDRQAEGVNPRPSSRIKLAGVACPGEMRLAGAMTGLASDADLRLPTGEMTRARIVAFFVTGRVALRASQIGCFAESAITRR